MDWFDLLNTQDPGSVVDPRAEETGYGFDAVNLGPGQGNLEQDYYVTDRGGVNTSYGEVFRPPTTSANTNWLSKLLKAGKTLGGKAADFAGTDRGLMAILAALASYKDRARPSGGGVGTAYAGYKPLQRQMVQGPYGDIARYAAQGGIMHAYAQGGAVNPFPMQDGGFVLTADAVRGAGGPQGIAQLVPGARMIRGPGTGTSDSIPATIQGPRGQTPAKVSNGEAYVDPKDVKRRGGAPAMYALMRAMERRA